MDSADETQTVGDKFETVFQQISEPDSVDHDLLRSRLLVGLFGESTPRPHFGRFELRGQIGRGGMGVVYRAWDPQLEREVAIKLVDTARFGPDMRERALREAKGLAKLAHPNVVSVFEAGIVDERVWIAMEFVPGVTFREWVATEPRPDPATIIRQWIAIGRGLMAVHAAGLVHRDVKPSNVLIGEDGRARLLDFGLAKDPDTRCEATLDDRGNGHGSNPSDAMSSTGHFVGTYAYAAPEQREGGPVDAAVDQYALCVSLWESLCGELPSAQHGAGPLEPPAGVKMSAKLRRALSRGLAETPEQRYPELGYLLADLEAAVEGPSRRLGLILGAAALAALLAGTVGANVGAQAAAPDPCAIDPSALDDTWGPARRAELHEQLMTTPLEFATITARRVEHALDAWGERWQQARYGACAATRIEGVQSDADLSLRSACLEHKRRALDVQLATLLEPERRGELAMRAPELIRELPSLDDCAAPRHLAEVEPLPDEGARLDQILATYDGLTRARTLASIGELELAQRQAVTLTKAAQPLGYAPLNIELMAFPGQLELLRGHVEQGAEPMLAAAREAQARRLDLLAARLLSELAKTAAGRWSRPDLERWLVEDAAATRRRLEAGDDLLLVWLQTAQAKLAAQDGDFRAALEGFRAAQTLALELGLDDDAADLDRYIAATLGQLARFDEARAALEAGRAAARERWGPSAPAVGLHEFDLAVLALDTGAFELAATQLDRAEAIYAAAFGPDSFRGAQVRTARAKLHMLDGQWRAATNELDAALKVYVETLGADDIDVAGIHEARGVVRYYLDDLPGSIESYGAALDILKRVLGPDNLRLAGLHSNIGESQLALGDIEAARASFARALSINDLSLPSDHPDLALPLKGRGQAQLELGRPALAIEDLERALALNEASGGEPLELADIRFSLARALVLGSSDADTRSRAVTLARQARTEFAGINMEARVTTIDTWLHQHQ